MNAPSKTSLFSDACRELYAPGLNKGSFTTRGFRFLKRLVSSEFLACGNLDLRTRQLDMEFDCHHSSFGPAMERLAQLMPKYPLFNWDPTVNKGRPFCRSQFYSLREFRDLDLYHDVYRRIGADNHCAVYVPTDANSVMFFGLERKGDPDFSSDELALLELAQPHLSNAYNVARFFEMSVEDAVTPEVLLDNGLTVREADVLTWMCRGKSNAEIGILLGVGVYTIKAHVASIFNKAGVCNRLAAVIWAQRACRRHRMESARPACSVIMRPADGNDIGSMSSDRGSRT